MAGQPRLILAPPPEAGGSSGLASSAGSRARAVLASGCRPSAGCLRKPQGFLVYCHEKSWLRFQFYYFYYVKPNLLCIIFSSQIEHFVTIKLLWKDSHAT